MKVAASLIILSRIITTVTSLNSSCSVQSDSHHIYCEGVFSEVKELSTQLKTIVDNEISVFELRHVFIDTLPPGLFGRNATVKTMLFDDVHMKVLAIPELGKSPFAYIREGIERLEIYDTDGVFAWDFSQLPSMKSLRTLIIENSRLIAIAQAFSFAPDLRYVSITESELIFVHPHAFESLVNLTSCSLADNEIQELHRSVFTKPALKLYNLDLSDNKLQSLPDDFFTEMPALKEIKLDGNQLHVLLAAKTIWKQINQFWIERNQLGCHTLCWTAFEQNKPLFFQSAKCWHGNSSLPVAEVCAHMFSDMKANGSPILIL